MTRNLCPRGLIVGPSGAREFDRVEAPKTATTQNKCFTFLIRRKYIMRKYLQGTTDEDIVNYMFGKGESQSKTQFLNYKNETID